MIKSRRMRGGVCSTHGEKRNAYKISVVKPGGRRPLRRHRCRWEDNIKMNLRENGVIWTGSIWLRDRDQWRALVNTIVNVRVP
jgi:hypothetical protein